MAENQAPSTTNQEPAAAEIISSAKAAELRASGAKQVRRNNVALNKGGSFNLVQFAGGAVGELALLAVVEDPAALKDYERKEIAEALTKERARLKKG